MEPEAPPNTRGWGQGASKRVKAPDTLPASIEAEQGVLGSMLLSSDAIVEAETAITPEHFSSPINALVYRELLLMWRECKPMGLVNFTIWLTDRNHLATIGGPAFVTDLYRFVPTGDAIGHYLEILIDKYLRRQLIQACEEMAEAARERQDEPVQSVLEESQQRVCAIGANRARKRRTTKEVVASVIATMDSPEEFFGLSTGLKKLDAVIGGFAAGAQIVIAGGISGGKSSLAQLFADSLAVTRGISTAIFTFEMTENQTIQRIVQIRSEVSASQIARGEAQMFDVTAFHNAANEVANSPLHIISEELDVAGIATRCMQLRPRICCVDYLQIVPEKRLKGETTTDRLDRMGATLKQMARRFNMTVITLSQLNEDEKTYGSRMLTAHADDLLIIQSGEDDESKLITSKTIKVAKQRDGGRPSLGFSFVKAITKFREK